VTHECLHEDIWGDYAGQTNRHDLRRENKVGADCAGYGFILKRSRIDCGREIRVRIVRHYHMMYLFETLETEEHSADHQ
jgi:hypothetical protein